MCGKHMTEELVKEAFSHFGPIEEIWVLKDLVTQEPKVNQETECPKIALFEARVARLGKFLKDLGDKFSNKSGRDIGGIFGQF